VRLGREHDVTCARTHEGLPETLDAFADGPVVPRFALADLGYHGEADRLICPYEVTRTSAVDRRCRSG